MSAKAFFNANLKSLLERTTNGSVRGPPCDHDLTLFAKEILEGSVSHG